MMRNRLCSWALVLLGLLGLGSTGVIQCPSGMVLTEEGCVCLQCPQGQEPSVACGQAKSSVTAVTCQPCPTGTYSTSQDSEPCRSHTLCSTLNRATLSPGTPAGDTVCGDCLSGFSSAAKGKSPVLEACVRLLPGGLVRVARNVGRGSTRGVAGINATNVRSPEEKTTEYAVFALVPIFCVMGLLGILICNILKKKGYHCIPEKEAGDVEAAAPEKEGNPCPYVVDDPNEDTISVLVRLITEKKENAAALEELLLEYESKQMAISKSPSIKFPALPHLAHLRSLPRLCSHQHHLHTINGLALRSGISCSRCSQKKWPELLSPAPINTGKTAALGAKAPTPGEVTILSVGRFQVAQIPEQKPDPAELTPQESSDTDSVDTSPADEKSPLTSSSSQAKSKQEGGKLVIRLGETNLVI